MNNKKNSEFASSDSFYDITNFAIVAFVLGMLLAFPFIMCECLPFVWRTIFIIIAFVFASLISAFINLKKTKFFEYGIEVNHSIKLFSKHNRKIDLLEIKGLGYTYTGGRGSGGVGQLTVKFIKQGTVRTIKCTLDKHSAADVNLWAKKNNIPVEIG